jgi:hypothetical protein
MATAIGRRWVNESISYYGFSIRRGEEENLYDVLSFLERSPRKTLTRSVAAEFVLSLGSVHTPTRLLNLRPYSVNIVW